jgi:serine/threonine protein kinase
VVVGQYRKLRPIGDPSDGIFAAADRDGRPVTLKCLPGPAGPSAILRLRASPAVSSRPEHPNLMPVLDVGFDEGLGFNFAVFPPHSKDSRRLIAQAGPLEPAAAVRVVLQACAGLRALHDASIFPTELRPSDLALEQRPDGEIVVRLTVVDATPPDARDVDPPSVSESIPARALLAPEQRRGNTQADVRASIWQLGACLYWLLSGDLPSTTDDAGRVALIQDYAPWVEPELAVALHLALASKPDKRWPSLEALANALRPFSGGSESLSRAELEPIGRAARRHVAQRVDANALSSSGMDPSASFTNTSSSSTGLFRKLQQEPEALNALIGHTLAGKYRVLRVIGRGGMGAVFEVEAPDGTRVAAKLIDRRHVGQDEETYKRFVREAKAASSIDSPHIVRTLEAGIDPELKAPYIIMELLQGVDLKSVLKERSALVHEPTVRLFVQAARGIAAAHRQRIVHRDIKPANLFLHEQADGTVSVKVCDFGIAKRTSEADHDQTGSHDLTRTGGMLGSPLYMSPEQATNARNVDHRTDIWSLCISLYEALSGVKPWAGRAALGEIIVAICTQQVPPLRRVAPWVDRELAGIVHRGLTLELAERWQSIDDLIAALEPFTGGSDQFTNADLVPVRDEQRALSPSSLPPPPLAPDHDAATVMGGAASTSRAGSLATTGDSALPAPRSKARALAIGLGIAGVAALAAGWFARAPAAPEPEVASADTSTPTASTAPAPLPSTSARVVITPPEAEVTVDGKPAKLVDGALELSGPPGTSFEVVLSLGDGARQRASVVLAREGGAVPAALTISPALADKAPSKPGSGRPRVKPPVTADGAKAPPTATAAEPSKPPPDPTRKPEFKNEW